MKQERNIIHNFATVILICTLCVGMSVFLAIDDWGMQRSLKKIDKNWFSSKVLEEQLLNAQMINILLAIIAFTLMVCGSYCVISIRREMQKRVSDDDEMIEEEARDIRRGIAAQEILEIVIENKNEDIPALIKQWWKKQNKNPFKDS